MKQSMSVLVSESTAEWYTPPELIKPVREFFGGKIDLDPASNYDANERIRAVRWYGPQQLRPGYQDGLALHWDAERVFVNPPYCGKTAEWVKKAGTEYKAGHAREIILLVKSVPGYVWFEKLWCERPMCMLRRRPRFINEAGIQNGEAKQGHCFVYIGSKARWSDFKSQFSVLGRIIFPE